MFKVGDKVVCVKEIFDLKLYNIYTVSKIITWQDSICIKETKYNNSTEFHYFIHNFRSIKDIRKQKLKKLCF